MQSVNPYLNFPGNTEEAFTFYESVFGGEITGILRYRDMPESAEVMGVSGAELDKVAHMSLPLGEHNVLMASDTVDAEVPQLVTGTNFHLMIETDTVEEAERVFAALAESGSVTMPLMQSEWAERYGICVDKYGVQWMINYTGDVEFDYGPPE